jgi:RNA ligase
MIEKLERYYEDGLLLKQTHPVHDLTIWNYSPKVQYDRLWDEITLQCRGLVTNSKGEIVARPFKKFFNYEEYLENAPEMIPNEPFDVFEKMDGSLGILFNYKNDWILCTRGSFTSDQSVKGTQILNEYDVNVLEKSFTYLLEIIYPENRIVVSYEKEMLVLLGAIKTSTGDEMGHYNLTKCSKITGFPLVKKYNGISDYTFVKGIINDNQEGFVIRFDSGFRMKIKGDEYCRLHRILTNISNRDIWEYLKDNKSLDEIIEKVPDEFYNWVKNTIRDFENKFEEILGQVITDYWDIETALIDEQSKLGENMVYDEREYSKRFADEAFKKKYPHFLFSYRKELVNPIKTSEAIWDRLYPSYSKPFKNDDNEI